MNDRPFIVGLGGTTRPGSTSEMALGQALAAAERSGCETLMIGAAGMPREVFDPTVPGRSLEAAALVAALRRADGVVIATPSYHGGISGLVKNAIDFTEDMRADARAYFSDRAVGLIVCAEGPQAMGATLASLRAIVHALRGWPTPYAATINSSTKPFGAPGKPADPTAIEACERVGEQVARFARMMRSSMEAGA